VAVEVRRNLEGSIRTRGSIRDWRRGLPQLTDGLITLRSLRASDASLLFRLVTPAVVRYLPDAPRSPQEFRGFIRWTQAQRRRGAHICYAVVPGPGLPPAGFVQIWSVDRSFSTAEWGFVLGERYWGTGLFDRAARLLLDFAFSDLHVDRLEARAVIANARGNGALRKLAATPEGVLRSASWANGVPVDSMMWSILASDWDAIDGVRR
jgi:RimJ/RimL family protein N-acetyltransferase